MFRKFKRHYHLTKRAYFDAAKIGNLSLTISHFQGELLKYSENAPDQDKMARLSVLIYKFLDEKSDLHYGKVWDLIKSDFPEVTSAEDIKAIENGITRIETGGMPITIDDKEYTAKQIFKIIAEAGYYEQKEEAQKYFEQIARMPLVYNLFWYQFKSYMFDAFRIISVIFDLIQAIENHEKYSDKFKPEESHLKKCIYCHNMMVSMRSKSNSQLRASFDTHLEGTQYVINSFGMIFKINLEEEPLVSRHPALDALLEYISRDYTFEFVSLK